MPFTPGVAQEYTASTTATVTSTAGDAALSVSAATLTNGAFRLAQPVSVVPAKTAWTGPVSNDTFAVAFKQSIGAHGAAAHRHLQRERHVHAVHDPALGAAVTVPPVGSSGRGRCSLKAAFTRVALALSVIKSDATPSPRSCLPARWRAAATGEWLD